MRTVDPAVWSKSIRKPPLNLSRPMRFGIRPQEPVTRLSFHYAMKEYLRNCSVNGVKYITDVNIPACVRYSYALLLILLASIGLFAVILNNYKTATIEPSTVALREGLYSIDDVPFPAVGLCSNTVISRRALLDYTATLVGARYTRNKTYSMKAIRQNLVHLGRLLSMTLPQQPVDIDFIDYLTTADPMSNKTEMFKVSSLMFKFAPNCSTMLVRCSWRGLLVPCQELFQPRVTPLGFCCVFNSRIHPEDVFKLPNFLDLIGEEFGLSVVVKQDTDDALALRRASHDIDVLIFDGSDFPLLEGGGAHLYPAQKNASVYMSLTTSLHYSEEGYDHDIDTLRCRSRRDSGPHSGRSHARCLADCRRRSLAILCDCRLHTLPLSPLGWDVIPECSLTHLTCLNKHREKFVYYHPRGYETLEQEMLNAQDCTHCAPDCARVVYSASVAVTKFNLNKLSTDKLLDDLPSGNMTSIRLYYSSIHLKSYVFQSNSRWYEKFAKSGSEWALIVGATVVSVSEVVFHCSLRWRHHHRTRYTHR